MRCWLLLLISIPVAGAAAAAETNVRNGWGDAHSATVTCDAACIRGLAAAPLVVVPGVPGKILQPTFISVTYTYGTSAWLASASARLTYNGQLTSIAAPNFLQPFQGQTSGYQVAGATPHAATLLDIALVRGQAITFQPDTTYDETFDTGSAATATVVNPGSGYAEGDTGVLVCGTPVDPTYTVTAVSGGAVTAVSVSGGTGIFSGPGIGCEAVPTSGTGDGSLAVQFASITPLGNGSLSITTFYTVN